MHRYRRRHGLDRLRRRRSGNTGVNLVTGHGRAMPLLWLSVWKDEFKDQRNEDACLRRLSEVVPPGCRVTILADRGFGDHKLFAYLGHR